MLTFDYIQSHLHKNEKKLLSIRRHIHAHPELSYEEHQTVAYVKSTLDEWGVKNMKCTPTGLIAIVEGKRTSPQQVIALRADMDALPIEEKTNLPFSSKNKGVMHACGHDVHTTCLLGAIHTLVATKDEWEGTVKCIFQPGEEKNPGGASLMIKEGVLSKAPVPKAILGLHVMPTIPVGKLGFNTGIVMASADEIYITVSGKGGHAATPHLTTDTVYVASKIVVELQDIISRRKDPLTASVLSICAFNGGQTTNIIPEHVHLKGTLRSLDEKWRWQAHRLIKSYLKGLEVATGAKISLEISVGYPCVLNDKKVSTHAMELAKRAFGNEKVIQQAVRMGAEDFGYYSHLLPACFFRLGTGDEKKIKQQQEAGLHTSYLHIDEKAIGIGASAMAWFATQMLAEMGSQNSKKKQTK